MKKIIFIGAGNIATNLAINLAKNNYQIIQIFSKSLVNAKILADKVNANATNDLSKIKTADIIILSIKDDIIEEYDLLAFNDVRRLNILSRLLKSINFLIWGDV